MKPLTTLLSLLLFLPSMWCSAQVALPLGKGILRVDITVINSLLFYTDPLCTTVVHKIDLRSNDVGVMELKENKADPDWFVPEQFFPSYDIFMLRVDSAGKETARVFVDQSGTALWIKIEKGLTYLTWEKFLTTHISAVQKKDNIPVSIRSGPQSNASLIKNMETSDCFRVMEVRGDWMKIESDTRSGCSETKKPVRSGWIRWKNNDRLQISYSLIL